MPGRPHGPSSPFARRSVAAHGGCAETARRSANAVRRRARRGGPRSGAEGRPRATSGAVRCAAASHACATTQNVDLGMRYCAGRVVQRATCARPQCAHIVLAPRPLHVVLLGDRCTALRRCAGMQRKRGRAERRRRSLRRASRAPSSKRPCAHATCNMQRPVQPASCSMQRPYNLHRPACTIAAHNCRTPFCAWMRGMQLAGEADARRAAEERYDTLELANGRGTVPACVRACVRAFWRMDRSICFCVRSHSMRAAAVWHGTVQNGVRVQVRQGSFHA